MQKSVGEILTGLRPLGAPNRGGVDYSLYHFGDIIVYFPKVRGHVTLTMPLSRTLSSVGCDLQLSTCTPSLKSLA